jgi:hypothetical protein
MSEWVFFLVLTRNVNFRIVENHSEEYLDRYEEFIDLYNNSKLSVSDIRKHLGWSAKVYNRARGYAVSRGDLIDRRSPIEIKVANSKRGKKHKRCPKYYSRNSYNSKFMVIKRMGDEYRYFGTYWSERTCQELVKILKDNDWSYDVFLKVKDKLIEEYGE